ncbi:helix-turn-helix domain-containing protein [Burkholderia anthina]|uniref:helix-turn-helix domain-containing protein n=1 Tax=Burkholderia anthina TaxID=179879 RepID=UPI001588D258|nr:helix-turn-helix transcriptional regulator [Burkholderia anthina]
MQPVDFPSPLRKLRLSLGMSQEYVCRQLGLRTSGLSRIERGEQEPRAELLERIANFFGRAIDELHILYPERFPHWEPATAQAQARAEHIKRALH